MGLDVSEFVAVVALNEMEEFCGVWVKLCVLRGWSGHFEKASEKGQRMKGLGNGWDGARNES